MVFRGYQRLTRSAAQRQWNVEHGLPFKFAGVDTLGHHLCKLSVEFSLGLGVMLLYLTSDDNVFLKVRVMLRPTICLRLLL